ncbi:hypothetical protein Tco_0335317 [Tanacetum coccineum]
MAAEVPQTLEYISGQLNDAPVLEDFQDSSDDEEDTRSSQEYMNDLEEEYQARALLAKSKRFFKKGTQSSSTSAPSPSLGKNKGLIAESYNWDEKEVLSDENEVTKVKALMALAYEERIYVGKESTRNGEWTKISIKKVHTLLEMKYNDDRKSFLDYLCIDLNYVEEQRNNLLSKHRNLVQELNTCKEQLLVLKQAKLDLLTMQHVNTEILKENQDLRNELKELTSITETWQNSSNKVNQFINLIFVKSSADNSNVSSAVSHKSKLSEAEDSTLSNHSAETQKNTTDPSIVVTESSATNYDSVDESSSNPTFKAGTLKGITINEPSSAPARGNKSSSASKTNSAPADINQYHTGQSESSSRSRPSRPAMPFPSRIHCGYNDHQSDDCVYYPICEICGSYDHDTHGHNTIISLRRGIKPRNPQHITKNCETCGRNVHTISDHNDIE